MAQFQLPQLPRIPSLGRPDENNQERQLLRDAAEGQIEGEREGEGLFMRVLGYLGRPQHAVAGVVYDMIDGGDFSPFDRVGKALMGDEAYGIRDVIDEVAPGQWNNTLMPDWIPFVGGQERDLAKDIISLTGDVLTDPLMFVPIGGFMGKAFQKIPKEAPVLLKDLAKTLDKAGNPKLLKDLEKAGVEGVTEAGLKSANVISSGALQTTAEVKKIDSIWKEVTSNLDEYFIDPVTGKTRTDLESLRKGFEPYVGGLPFASKSVADQFREGSRTLAQLKLSFGLEKLGIKDVSLVPKAVDRMAAGVADMMGGMMSHLATTGPGKKMVDTFKSVFQWGTGNPYIDQTAMRLMGEMGLEGQQLKVALTEVRDLLGSKAYDKDFMRTFKDLVERPHEDWGRAFRDVPIEHAETIKKFRDYTDRLYDLRKQAGLPGKKLDWSNLATDDQAYRHMYKAYMKGERGFKSRSGWLSLHLSPRELKKQALADAKRAIKDIEKGSPMIGLHPKIRRELRGETVERYKKRLIELRDMEFDGARDFVTSTNPLRVSGYLPRKMDDRAKDILATFIRHPKVTYAGSQAYETFLTSTQHRAFLDHSIDELNELFVRGGLPHNYMDNIMDQVRGLARKDKKVGKDLTSLVKYMDNNYRLFIDDPIQATWLETMDLLRASSNKQAIDQILYLTSKRIEPDELHYYLGESTVVLSPKGMEATLGKEWRDAVGEKAAALYDGLTKELHLKGEGSLNDLFRVADDAVIAKAKTAGIPLHSISNDVLKDINKVVDFRTNADDWRSMLKVFDDVTDYWKASTLALFPAYHARNLVGNIYLGMIGGSVPLSRPTEAFANYKDALDLGRHAGMFSKEGGFLNMVSDPKKFTKAMDNVKIEMPNGNAVTGREILTHMWKERVIGGGFYSAELGKDIVQRQPKTLAGKAARLASREGPVLGGAFAAGNAMETVPRMAHFVGMLRQGKSFTEAGASVRKYFHDFQQLSRFEKNVFRRAMPFYTWTRKNLPLQLEAMVTQPEKFGQLGRLAEAMQSDEVKNMDKSLLPKWVQEQFGVPTRINENGDVEVNLLRSWLPALDLMAVVHENPAHAMARTVMGLAHPIPKVFIEGHMNMSAFTGKPIERFPGESMKFFGVPGVTEGSQVPKRVVHAVKSMPWGRMINELNRLSGSLKDEGFEDMSMIERIVSASGIAPNERKFSVEGLVKGLKYDINERIGQLGRAYRRAKRVAKKTGDNSGVEYYRNLLEEAKSHKKDLAGVGKGKRSRR